MAIMICRSFRDDLAYKGTMHGPVYYTWMHPFLDPQSNCSAILLLLHLMKAVYLFTYSKEAQNQVHQAGKGPIV
jgi:hypothetical protein